MAEPFSTELVSTTIIPNVGKAPPNNKRHIPEHVKIFFLLKTSVFSNVFRLVSKKYADASGGSYCLELELTATGT
jgi:hypothetical protein